MASVHLNFVPPDEPDIRYLRVYEAPASTGPWTMIEQQDGVGSQGSYISSFTTDQATSDLNWFAIEWVDNKGAVIPLSNAIRGGTVLALGEVVDRVLLRDPTLKELQVLQEARGVMHDVLGENWATINLADINDKQLSGIVMLTMAKVYTQQLLVGRASSFTAGLIRVQSQDSNQARLELIQALVDQANNELGLNYSVVFQLEDIDITGLGATSGMMVLDESRLLQVEIG